MIWMIYKCNYKDLEISVDMGPELPDLTISGNDFQHEILILYFLSFLVKSYLWFVQI